MCQFLVSSIPFQSYIYIQIFLFIFFFMAGYDKTSHLSFFRNSSFTRMDIIKEKPAGLCGEFLGWLVAGRHGLEGPTLIGQLTGVSELYSLPRLPQMPSERYTFSHQATSGIHSYALETQKWPTVGHERKTKLDTRQGNLCGADGTTFSSKVPCTKQVSPLSYPFALSSSISFLRIYLFHVATATTIEATTLHIFMLYYILILSSAQRSCQFMKNQQMLMLNSLQFSSISKKKKYERAMSRCVCYLNKMYF